MGELEIRVLELLNQEYAINYITRELNIKEEYLADIIISLEDKGLAALVDKKWKITEKGKDIFEKKDKLLKKLKVRYIHGEIDSRDEYDRRRKELEDISQIISSTDEIIEVVQPKITTSSEMQVVEQKSKDEHLNDDTIIDKNDLSKEEPIKKEPIKKICSKCGIENKPESNFCRKCGTNLKG